MSKTENLTPDTSLLDDKRFKV